MEINTKLKIKLCRDYIHINDLCSAIIKCINIKLNRKFNIINLGLAKVTQYYN